MGDLWVPITLVFSARMNALIDIAVLGEEELAEELELNELRLVALPEANAADAVDAATVAGLIASGYAHHARHDLLRRGVVHHEPTLLVRRRDGHPDHGEDAEENADDKDPDVRDLKHDDVARHPRVVTEELDPHQHKEADEAENH